MLELILTGLALGLRHGIDWDHLVAIADITGSAAAGDPARAATGAGRSHAHDGLPGTEARRDRNSAARASFLLATFYALGHATLVVALGLLAIWASTILPEWIDPIMERIVGVTLVLLGIWILYSIVRHGRSFRLLSRWMLVFSLAAQGWARVRSWLSGKPVEHVHILPQYGPKTAFGVGMVHGIGAETGSQALLLASVAGATSAVHGSLMLLAFTMGLLISNSLVAAFSAFGFVSSAAQRTVYAGIALLAGVFSLVVGVLFITGQGAELPDLQHLIDLVFGPAA